MRGLMTTRLDRVSAADSTLGTGQGRTVLVVDPDRTARTVIVNLLRPEGYRVLEAERADKALFLALEKSIDAFLLAQYPAGLAAADFCSRIRAMARYRHVPILSILMPFDEKAAGEAFAAGADDFLTRPVNGQNLRTRLAGRLQRAQATPPMADVRPGLASYLVPRVRQLHDTGAAEPDAQSAAREACVLAVRLTLPGASAEAAFRTLARYLGMQVDCVYRHGGYVARLEGDGLRAVFESSERIGQAAACLQELRTQVADGEGAARQGDPQLRASLCEGLLSPSSSDELLEMAAALCAEARPMELVVPGGLLAQLESARAGLMVRAIHSPSERASRFHSQGGEPPPARPRAA